MQLSPPALYELDLTRYRKSGGFFLRDRAYVMGGPYVGLPLQKVIPAPAGNAGVSVGKPVSPASCPETSLHCIGGVTRKLLSQLVQANEIHKQWLSWHSR